MALLELGDSDTYVFTFFGLLPSTPSSAVRFRSVESSLAKLGPVGTTGVLNGNGLGSMLSREKFHIESKPDGLGNRLFSRKCEGGKPDIGVSDFSLSPRIPYLLLLDGGIGRAKGLGGPLAPALKREFADGDGGGNIRPEE
jgi:hypothetical protein